MVGSVFSINLSNFVYKDSSSVEKEIIQVGAPKQCRFLNAKNHPTERGVYVIFSPAVSDYSNKGTDGNGGKACIYVGEGNIKDRLYRHKYEKRFVQGIDYEVIYYIIEEQKDRKAVERILIKHYDPTFNKEGTSKVTQVGAHLNFAKNFNNAASELKEIFFDRHFRDKKNYGDLFDFSVVVARLLKDGYSFEDIDININKYHSEEYPIEKLADFCGFIEPETVVELLGL
ncbi:hypothetical protein CON45_21495 [Priestia megaterium]|uniref:GIY-YIG nuclease family protein n=1 Tax=Priestia megaterium TaxID=1404 RepID=UPI000BED9368|nr:GIY-YIG nuclease family protein [Priestia megaterium]PEA37017.1 hypothetical protein CON45_21495 [Priestia megaterium]PEE48980.1 hypothetical protein COM71_02820 [Priestia megaterium]